MNVSLRGALSTGIVSAVVVLCVVAMFGSAPLITTGSDVYREAKQNAAERDSMGAINATGLASIDTLSLMLANTGDMEDSLGVLNQTLLDSLSAIIAAVAPGVTPFDTFYCGWSTLGASAKETWSFTQIKWFEFGTDQLIYLHLYLPSGQEDTLRLVAGASDAKRWACDSIEVIATAAGATYDYRFGGFR